MNKSILRTNYLALVAASIMTITPAPASSLDEFIRNLMIGFLLVHFTFCIVSYSGRALRIGVWGVGWISNYTKTTEFARGKL